MKTKINLKSSFTLIELLIVIAILGIIAAFISINFLTALRKGRDARRKSDMEQIQRGIELYYEDQKSYPKFNIFLNSNYALCQTNIYASCPTSPKENTYMEKIPADPLTSQTYAYAYPADGSNYKLYACLENTQQILSYAAGTVTPPAGWTCTNKCFAKDGTTSVNCVYVITSPNTVP